MAHRHASAGFRIGPAEHGRHATILTTFTRAHESEKIKMRHLSVKARIRARHRLIFGILKYLNINLRLAIAGIINFKTNSKKRKASRDQQQVHAEISKSISKKSTIRVAFIVTDLRLWKTESIFINMLSDGGFDPTIVILPSPYQTSIESSGGETAIVSHCEENEYNYTVARRTNACTEQALLNLVAADIFFLPNAQSGPNETIYNLIIQKHLTCYVPYHIEATHENCSQTNMFFHNSTWFIFVAHNTSREVYRCRQAIKARNVIVTGYPIVELLAYPRDRRSVWKPQQSRKRKVILAPHHTIGDSPNSHSNFLKYCSIFQELAVTFQDSIQFSFKPHPSLRTALSKQANWSRERIESYFCFWNERTNCQLDEGSYVDLFLQSDAMIHDCSSFLGEYLFVNKPVMFLLRDPEIPQCLNSFGVEALEATVTGADKADIEQFLSDVTTDLDRGAQARSAFLMKHIKSIDRNRPSDAIIEHIRKAIRDSER